MAFVNEKDPNNSGSWRTVDHERDIILTYSPGRGIHTFYLNVKGKRYSFWAYDDINLVIDKIGNKNDIVWHIQEIEPASESDKDIKAIITEAMHVFGMMHSHELVRNVEVDFKRLMNRGL